MATDEPNITPTTVKPKKPEPGFNAENQPFPGVDTDTGERQAVTWDGLRAEFGARIGSRLYNDIAIAAFGGPQPGRPALSLLTLQDKYLRPRGKHETEEEFSKTKERFSQRRAKVEQLLAEAVKGE